jgi:magnesium-transporting ATPase (P-type)
VRRDHTFVSVSVKDIVPGDIVKLAPGVVYCDMVVLQSDQVVVDESALTGEATPIVKKSIDPAMKNVTYVPNLHKANTISAGTEILQVKEDGMDVALVIKTGSFTAKGELLTEVLSYQRHKFLFDDEVKVVLAILLLEALVLLSLVFYFLQGQWVYAWFYGTFRYCLSVDAKYDKNRSQFC